LRQLEGERAAEELVAERDLVIEVMKEVAAHAFVVLSSCQDDELLSARLFRLHRKP
jgi:hypothetical protein